MADLNDDEKRALYLDALNDLKVSGGADLAQMRQICAAHSAKNLTESAEARSGKGSFPEPKTYCMATLASTVRQNKVGGLYGNLVLQQTGMGRQFTGGNDAEIIGDRHAILARGIRRAANDGSATYVDIVGTTRDLTCPLALDSGVTIAAANADPKKPARIPLNAGQIGQIVDACYKPDIKELTLDGKGPFPIQQLGLIAGENIGRVWQIETNLWSSKEPTPLTKGLSAIEAEMARLMKADATLYAKVKAYGVRTNYDVYADKYGHITLKDADAARVARASGFKEADQKGDRRAALMYQTLTMRGTYGVLKTMNPLTSKHPPEFAGWLKQSEANFTQAKTLERQAHDLVAAELQRQGVETIIPGLNLGTGPLADASIATPALPTGVNQNTAIAGR